MALLVARIEAEEPLQPEAHLERGDTLKRASAQLVEPSLATRPTLTCCSALLLLVADLLGVGVEQASCEAERNGADTPKCNRIAEEDHARDGHRKLV